MHAPKTNFERSQIQMNCKHVDWISHKYPVFWKFRQKQLGKGWGSWILQNWKWCWEFLSLPGRPTRSICQLFEKTGQHFHLIFLALMWLSRITQGLSVLPTGTNVWCHRCWLGSPQRLPPGCLVICQSLKVPIFGLDSMKISRHHIPDGGKTCVIRRSGLHPTAWLA